MQRFTGPAGAAAIVIGWLAACAGQVVVQETAGAATGSGGSTACALATPPSPGPVQAPDGVGTATFAITRFRLGDADPDGTPDSALGWMRYGYDLDGMPTDHPDALCKPRNGAKPTWIHPPGCVGVDNGFGRAILPILLGVTSDLSAQVDQRLAAGGPTILLSLTGLGSGASYRPLPAQLALGGDLMSAPHYDGTDTWPVQGGTEVPLGSSYLVGDTWVWRAPAGITLSMSIPLFPWLNHPLKLNLHHAILSMKLDPSHQKATDGHIAGALSSDDFVNQLKMEPGLFDPTCCYVTCDSIVAQFEQAADILQDGTQDPTQKCDGISLGLGFDAARVQLGPTIFLQDAGPPPNPCAVDGG